MYTRLSIKSQYTQISMLTNRVELNFQDTHYCVNIERNEIFYDYFQKAYLIYYQLFVSV